MAKTWIKLYTEILSDPKMGRMNDKMFRRTIELFLIAGKEDRDGMLPSLDDIAWSLHSTVKEIQTVLSDLKTIGIIEEKSEGYLIEHFSERQNSDSSRSEINRRYYENSKLRKSEIQTSENLNKTSESDNSQSENKTGKKSEIQTLEEEVEEEVEVEEELKKELKKETPPAKKTATEPKQKYGQFHNVLLTNTEYAKLCEQFSDADTRIENFSASKAAKGYTYKSDYAAILTWARKDAEKPKVPPKPEPKKTYTFAEVGEMMRNGELTI